LQSAEKGRFDYKLIFFFGFCKRRQLMKKMEERNFSISNASRRWHFLKNSTLKVNISDEGLHVESDIAHESLWILNRQK
jgi:hypothetical protein